MPFEAYIKELRDIRRSGAGVGETSYYPALSDLFNDLGKKLKPKVRCIINIRNKGAGLPDGGLFTPEQFQRSSSGEPEEGQLPSRGAIEVKSPKKDVVDVAQDEQVAKYLKTYGQVLATNLRDFVIVTRAHDGTPILGERYTLADSDAAFWEAVNHSRNMAAAHGVPLSEYLQRTMLHNAPLTSPEAVAWFLASYARDARFRIEDADLPALSHLRTALEQALGLTFEGEKGDHFFRSTLIQTLFYGVFSAWVLWSKQQPAGAPSSFDWHSAGWHLRVPMIGALFSQIATRDKLKPLGLAELMDWTGNALNRVDRGEFFSRFEEEHAVQYFYEPFLEAFDPELRKELGVWYTPPEIVKYMVERVDTVLREELDIPDGLADDRVYVLDPCCGTGAYLVEVIHRIRRTLSEKDEDALLAHTVKQAVTSRIFGFEILPAPFVVSHLQIGLLMQNMGAPLTDDAGERAGVYLTNALTGWEPPEEPKDQIPFPGMQQEREASDEVKREKAILVILGNPPYNAFAGVAMDEERELTNAYRTTTNAPKPQGQGLNDLYVRFFRMAERRIVEKTKRGVVCFISNYSWLDGLSFTGMREKYLQAFDRMWIDNLHGDRIISEYAPDGRTSETVFAIRGQSPGIKIGTTISLLVARQPSASPAAARLCYRDFDDARADERRARLLGSLAEPSSDGDYCDLEPLAEIGLPFKPAQVAEDYLAWPLLPELFPVSYPGVKTSRDHFLVDIDREALLARLEKYFDPSVSHEEMGAISPQVMHDGTRFSARTVREELQARGPLWNNVVPYHYRPFDLRWIYWEPETKLLDEKRSEYFPQVFEGNEWISAGQRNRKASFYQPQYTRALADHHIVESNVYMFPTFLAAQPGSKHLFDSVAPGTTTPNLSAQGTAYVTQLKSTVNLLTAHTIAALHSPRYAAENATALRQDYPRIPLPATKEALEASATLGEVVAALLDVEKPVPAVTEGAIRPELAAVGSVSHAEGKPLNPDAGDLRITAGWGYWGKAGVTMPGQGRLAERAYTPEELDAIRKGSAERDMPLDQALELLGDRTCDVYLNDAAYWRNIPLAVWEYTIGGYQVIKKWLSYREHKVLGRDLKAEEARYVTEMARRIAAIILLQPELDANYDSVKSDTYRWPREAN